MYRYKLTSLHASSDKYGKCEVCHSHASEVFFQTEEKQFNLDAIDAAQGFTEPFSWTQHDCTNLFGHKDCLQAAQK